MSHFDEGKIGILREELLAVPGKAERLAQSFLNYQYQTDAAKEYAHHGVARRISVIGRCIKVLFDNLPPDENKLPSRDTLLDTSINIQSFIFNTFGLLDNLAYVWVHEREVKKSDGRPLTDSRIGFGEKYTDVRNSFSDEMKSYLESRAEWFKYLESYRHALAHRIPLYIPPFELLRANAARFYELEARIHWAAGNKEIDEFRRLKTEQDLLCRFVPEMKHSMKGVSPSIIIHPQVLADFATVEEISRRVLGELGGAL